MQCEFYKHVLKAEIVSRYHGKLLFDECELWYLLYNLLEAAFYLEPTGKKIGDVHPLNIVINEAGRAKIVPACMLPHSLNNYDKIVESKLADSFLGILVPIKHPKKLTMSFYREENTLKSTLAKLKFFA
jgi:hypothetical protein